MKFRKMLCGVLAALCLASGCVTAHAAGEGLSNLRAQVNTYTPGMFSDVALAAWYTPYIPLVYESGLMTGAGNGGFNPGGNITLGETCALAARIYSLYHTGKAEFRQKTPWYGVYADYALKEGILAEALEDYTRAATRAEFAAILSRALPESALTPINEIADNTIPDVSVADESAAEIYLLYRAGILTGNEKNFFQPETNIRRSEVAALVARLAYPEMRQSFVIAAPVVYPDLTEQPRQENAFFAHAAVLGNSLVDGLRLYSGLSANYFGGTGLTVFNNRLSELLQGNYDRVYIEFGINEIGGSQDSFINRYREIVASIRKAMPDAEIYLMALTPVTKARNDEGSFTAAKIQKVNTAIRDLAEESECWYLDCYTPLCDDTGFLPAAYAGWDGSPHLEVAGYVAWAEVIRTHYAEQ